MAKYKPYPPGKRLTNEQLADYEFGEFWGLQEGYFVLVKDLRDNHLKKIVEHLENRISAQRMLPYILAEIERRKIDKLVKKTKAGKILYGKEKV